MPRKKAAQNATILPWLSRRIDEREGRFIQIGNSLLLSTKDKDGRERNPFLLLSQGARILYLCMAMESGGRREFIFPQAAAKKYGIADRSFWRYIDELADAGFLEVQSMANIRKPNEYRFSFCWKAPI